VKKLIFVGAFVALLFLWPSLRMYNRQLRLTLTLRVARKARPFHTPGAPHSARARPACISLATSTPPIPMLTAFSMPMTLAQA